MTKWLITFVPLVLTLGLEHFAPEHSLWIFAASGLGDVLQDEATEAESKSGRPMFGDRFPG